ncbi:MAG TPA: nucleoside diphosphate kinase regulator [Lacunisphaera sp.]|nr:nucleoside diphosphate kinase regulator [Lacunisphaera sp.]
MTSSPLYITRPDHHRLRILLSSIHRPAISATLEKLREELDRATIIDPAAVPPDTVTMGARVQFEDLYSGEVEEYTLSFPEHADIGQGRLSILTPVGTALIGYRQGNIVEWPTPGGLRRLKIHHVAQPVKAGQPLAAS